MRPSNLVPAGALTSSLSTVEGVERKIGKCIVGMTRNTYEKGKGERNRNAGMDGCSQEICTRAGVREARAPKLIEQNCTEVKSTYSLVAG